MRGGGIAMEMRKVCTPTSPQHVIPNLGVIYNARHDAPHVVIKVPAWVTRDVWRYVLSAKPTTGSNCGRKSPYVAVVAVSWDSN